MARKPKTNYEKNGQSYFRIKRKVPFETGYTYKEFYGKSESEAVGKFHDYLANHKNNTEQEISKESLNELLDEWFWNIYYRSFIKDTTFARYESVYSKYIKPLPIMKSKIVRLTTQDFQKVYNDLSDKKLASDHTLKLMKIILKAFFEHAVQQHFVPVNIMTGVIIPKKKLSETYDEAMDEDKLEYFTSEEIKLLLEGSKGHDLHEFIKIKLGTGLRRGELLGMKWDKVDLISRTLDVSASVTNTYVYAADHSKKMQSVTSTPKNRSSKRLAPFPELLIPDFKSIKHNQKLDKLKAGESYQDDGLVFCTSVGTPLHPSNIEKSWRSLLKKLKIPHRKLHSLRHTFATQLFANGVQIEIVSKLLGHKSLETTQQIYVHVLPETKAYTVEMLSNILK